MSRWVDELVVWWMVQMSDRMDRWLSGKWLDLLFIIYFQITVTEDGIIGVHGWLPFDKYINNYYTFEKDATMFNAK